MARMNFQKHKFNSGAPLCKTPPRIRISVPWDGVKTLKGLALSSDPACLTTLHLTLRASANKSMLSLPTIIMPPHAFVPLYLPHANTPFLFFTWIIPAYPLRLIRVFLIKEVLSLLGSLLSACPSIKTPLSTDVI